MQATPQQSMSYAQALNEAKQVIVQQQYRIKADAEKIKQQQQTIVDQSSALVEHEKRTREQSTEIQRLADELRSAADRVTEATIAKEQAEAVIDRQGQRMTGLQSTLADFERRVAELEIRIGELTTERDNLAAQLPSAEDEEALAAMAELLEKRPATLRRPSSASPMRIAEVVSDGEGEGDPLTRAEAA